MRATRLAFVGRGVLHRHWTLSAPAAGVEPAFFERDRDDLEQALTAFAPDVVVVFTPRDLPAGLIASLDTRAMAFLTEPLPLPAGDGDPWDRSPQELWGAAAGVPAIVGGFDPGEYDRILTADPLVATMAPELRVWRSPPLPVDDLYFAELRRPPRRPKPLFLGPSTEHRETMLVFPKHGYDLSHIAFGLTGEPLREALEAASVGVVLNEDGVPRFQPEIALHLAAGHLVLAEPMAPTRGLEPGLDHLVGRGAHEIMRFLDQLAARPQAWEQVRRRGRFKAEAFRASRVWPRLLADLEVELRSTASV